MITNPAILASVMRLPDDERLEIAMTILDQASPGPMDEDEILAEAERRQDELESGLVNPLSFDELVSGLAYHSDRDAK